MRTIQSPYLTTFEAGDYLRVSHKTLEKWRLTGQGPEFHRLGRKCFYTVEGLDNWAQSQRVERLAEEKRR